MRHYFPTATESQSGDILALLPEAGAILASSLDYETTLRSVVQLVVPRLCDGCIVDLEEGDSLEPVATAHMDPEKEAIYREMRRRYPLSVQVLHPGSRAFQAGEPVALGETTDDIIRAYAQDAEHAHMIRTLGTRHLVSVPLIARGKIIGVLNLAYDSSGRRPFQGDAPLLRDLAARIALAVDYARLYRETQIAAERFSSALHSVTDPFMLLDSQWRYVFLNTAAKQVFSKDYGKPGGVVGEVIWEVLPALRGTPLYEAFHRAQAERVPVDLELNFPGSRLWFEVRAYPYDDGLAVYARSITDRRQAQERLEASLREKPVLLQEIHHRVKNNLQIVCSLLSLQVQRTQDGVCRAALKESGSRIHAMALVHEKLYSSSDLDRIEFGDYVQDLAARLRQLYQEEGGRIALQVRTGRLVLDIDTAIPCGLILHELITNALVHAFPGGRIGEVLVEVEAGPNGEARLRVSDNGVGMPEELPEDGAHLGLELVRSLVQQIRGDWRVESRAGTRFTVTFLSNGGRHD